LEQRELEHKV